MVMSLKMYWPPYDRPGRQGIIVTNLRKCFLRVDRGIIFPLGQGSHVQPLIELGGGATGRA